MGVDGDLKELAKKALTIKPNFAYTEAEVGLEALAQLLRAVRMCGCAGRRMAGALLASCIVFETSSPSSSSQLSVCRR